MQISYAWGVLLLVCLTALPAHAESERGTVQLDSVVVTANKESKDLQEMEASLDVFSDVNIKDSGVNNFAELTNYMPNVLSKVSYGINRIIFRGIEPPNGSMYAPSGFFVDDVPYIIPELRNQDLLDVERIEVLKGPQGTLYGSNTESGVVNIVSRKPGNAFGGDLSFGYESFNTLRGKVSISAPILDDTLFGLFAVSGLKSDGPIENLYDGTDAARQDHKNGRIALRWLPSDCLAVDLSANVFDYDDRDGSFRLKEGAGSTDRGEINWDGDNKNHRWGNSQSVRVEFKGKKSDLLSITTRNSFDSDYAMDADLTPLHLWDYNLGKSFEAYSQEFRLSSAEDRKGPWKWVTGIYGMTQETEFSKDSNMVMVATREERETDIRSHNMAAFGQTTYTFAEDWHLTGGLRVDHTQQHGDQDYVVTVGGFPVVSKQEADLYNTELLPKIALSYDLSKDIMLYASFSKGYLAGGFNAAMGNTVTSFTYDPERMWSYEAGVKSAWFDNRLQINASAFWLDINDKQVMEIIGVNRSIDNADSAVSRGLEMSAKARPVQGLDLFAGLGFLDTSFTRWSTPTYDYEGKTLPFAPKYTYNAGAQYRHSTGVFGRLDMTGRSAFYTDPENEYECEGFRIYNARLGYETENWDISLWCKNLLDTEYYTEKREWSAGSVAVTDGAPRTVGIEYNLRF